MVHALEIGRPGESFPDKLLIRLSEPFRPQQRISEVKEKTCGNEARQCVIEQHGCVPLKMRWQRLEPLARIGVTDGYGEKPKTKGQHHDVQHRSPPEHRLWCAATWRVVECGSQINQSECSAQRPRSSVSMEVKCHSAHKFSRRRVCRRYKNLIKANTPSSSLAHHKIAIMKPSAPSRNSTRAPLYFDL